MAAWASLSSLGPKWTRREQKQGDSSDKDRKPISWQAWKGPAEDEPPKNARADGKTELRSRRKEDEKGRSKDDRKDRAEARSKRHEKPDDEKRGLDERPKSRGKPATQRIEDGRGEPRRPRRIVERKPDRRSPPRSYYREPRHSTYRRSRSRSPYSRLPPPRDHHRSPRRRTPPPSRWQASRFSSGHVILEACDIYYTQAVQHSRIPTGRNKLKAKMHSVWCSQEILKDTVHTAVVKSRN